MKKNVLKFAFVFSILAYTQLNAAVKTWTGAASSVWNNNSNWSGGVPGNSDTAIIPGSLFNYPVISTANTVVRRIVINGGLSNLTNSNGRSLTVTGSMEINNGVYNASSNFSTPNLTINNGSVVTGSSCVFNVSGYILLNGGSLNLSSVFSVSINDIDLNGGTITVNATTAANTFSGIMSIDGGSLVVASGSGNLSTATSGQIDFISGEINANNQSLDIKGRFSYTGGTLSNVALVTVPVLTLNTSGTFILPNKFRITDTLSFINGKIQTSAKNLITFKNTAFAIGANDNRHVVGPVRKEVTTSNSTPTFTFPIGNGGYYAPLTISNYNTRSGNDSFTAQYFKATNANVNGTLATGLTRVSVGEYWILNRTSSATPQTVVDVALSYNDTRSGAIGDITALRVVEWNGSQWLDFGRSTSSTGNNNSGTVLSNGNVSSFGTFTLGSTSPLNPLPVNLLAFDAFKLDQAVQIHWTTTNEINVDKYEILKSVNGTDYVSIGSVRSNNASESINQYSFIDNNPVEGMQYYRLKQVDLNADFALSHVKSVLFAPSNNTDLVVFPSPATSEINVVATNETKDSEIQISVFNANGQLVLKSINTGNIQTLDVNQFESGVYTIQIQSLENTYFSKFVKK